jgi:ERCC4-related helicase
VPSKLQYLRRVLDERRIAADRMRQVVVFTRLKDTLDDIVRHLHGISTSLLIGTYSGERGRYVDPTTRRWIGVERDEIKHRFLRDEIVRQ